MAEAIAQQLGGVTTSRYLAQSLERAHAFARDQNHRVVTLEHALFALTDDPEAVLMLEASGVDLNRLRADVTGHLNVIPELRAPGPTDPSPDNELLRILRAAADAAKQSRRRQIDGAIVVAAIVGDGRSPAAGILRTFGLSFETAIRALQAVAQRALQTPPVQPVAVSPPQRQARAPQTATPPPPPAPAPPSQEASAAPVAQPSPPRPSASSSATPSTDEILASVRARLKSAEAAQRVEDTSPAMSPAAVERRASVEAALEEVRGGTMAPGLPVERYAGDLDPATAPARIAEGSVPHEPAQQVADAPQPERAEFRPQAPARVAPRGPLPPTGNTAQWPPEGRQGQSQSPLASSRAPTAPGPSALPTGAPHPIQPAPPMLDAGPGGLPPYRGPNGAPPLPGQVLPQAPPQMPPPGARAAPPGPPQPQRAGGPRTTGRPAQRAQAGPGVPAIVAALPSRLVADTPQEIEVRLAQSDLNALFAAAHAAPLSRDGRGPTYAVSLRLRAPKGGLLIENGSPETQWLDGDAAFSGDDFASWRWRITPRRRGRVPLQAIVGVRVFTESGLAAETALPDTGTVVTIASNYTATIKGAALITTIFLAGAGAAALLIRFVPGLARWLGG